MPENLETEAALIILLLAPTAPAQDDGINAIPGQFLWLLAILQTIVHGLNIGNEGSARWEPESAFRRIHDQLDAQWEESADSSTIASQAREIINILDKEGMVDKEVLLFLLHSVTASRASLEGLSTFLAEELEVCRRETGTI